MKIYLFRHAEKENFSGHNPPLSRHGLQQAEKLSEYFTSANQIKPNLLMSSPKARAQQTLAPLSTTLKLPLQILEDLDEKQNHETPSQFLSRIRNRITWMTALSKSAQNPCLVAVTHMDWLIEALVAIPCDTDLNQDHYSIWMPTQYMEFEVLDGVWNLQNFRSIKC